MGANSSSFSELTTNPFLQRFVGKEVVSEKDPFWNQLLSYSFRVPHCSSDARLLEESTLHLCKMLAQNNLQSGNLCTLIRVFLKRVAELKTSTQKEDHVFVWQTYNALFIIRSSLKYLLENFSEGRIVQHLSVVVPDAARTAAFLEDGLDGLDMADNESRPVQTLLEEFLHSLLTLLVEVPVLNFSYVLHLEAINTLLIVLSVQMFIPRIAHKSLFFDCMMQGNCAKDAHILVKTLLDHFVKHEECPAELLKPQESSPSFLYGITAAVAAGLWAVLTLGYGSRGHKPEPEDRGLLANQSLLLLMVLTNHYTHDKGVHNPYRIALCMFSNSQDGGTPGALVPPFKTNFANLYDAFCSHLKEDQATLLLYSLLHQNLNFRTYILSKTNIDQLVIPLLKILYYAQDRNFHHIYMALIVLLILSEDDAFNKSVHELVVKNITWYTERNISEITLGGLIVLVSIRTIQYNMTGMRIQQAPEVPVRTHPDLVSPVDNIMIHCPAPLAHQDKYLHTNCLAALANMSSQFHSLHPYVTQRIVSMFESLTKKHDRIVTQLRERATEVQSMEEDPECEILLSDLAVLEDSIRMVLEIINSCLTNMLPHNPHLIYTLLYKCERFSGFKTHAKFYDIIQNIDTVLAYFTQRLEQNEHHNLTVHQVLDIIKQGILQWPRDRLRKFPDLKFKYVEEDQPEEFFIPYVWSLVYHSSNLYWDPDRIELFTLNSS